MANQFQGNQFGGMGQIPGQSQTGQQRWAGGPSGYQRQNSGAPVGQPQQWQPRRQDDASGVPAAPAPTYASMNAPQSGASGQAPPATGAAGQTPPASTTPSAAAPAQAAPAAQPQQPTYHAELGNYGDAGSWTNGYNPHIVQDAAPAAQQYPAGTFPDAAQSPSPPVAAAAPVPVPTAVTPPASMPMPHVEHGSMNPGWPGQYPRGTFPMGPRGAPAGQPAQPVSPAAAPAAPSGPQWKQDAYGRQVLAENYNGIQAGIPQDTAQAFFNAQQQPWNDAAWQQHAQAMNAYGVARDASVGMMNPGSMGANGVDYGKAQSDPSAAGRAFAASGYTPQQALQDGWGTGVGTPGWQSPYPPGTFR